ncbi:LysR family transcriptional regulator [Thalassovita aquimarina]|uniref:LysR family transcriptional regulator n=1 Tax=Thalassovita aquimarina TaxID=2785917 RepID=A0ABS5HN67_9RHOB|nr:LysR family transcriptional regulator [Thalassovita aquimarina]MBR9650380.1 LysR family transcriptional regulator [Thalassovita aquimarina]
MAIKVEMMRCFRAVADHGSLAEAAAHLGRTASAVSMMLKQFEDHIGAPLFEAARKSNLTPLGRMIYAEVRNELDHFDRTISTIEDLSRGQQGHVRLAVTPSVAQMVLPRLLTRFLDEHPDVRIDIRDMDSEGVQSDLMAERADIGLASIGPMPGFERYELFSDHFGVVCRADCPLVEGWDNRTWEDLAGERFIANGLCAQIRDPGFLPLLDRSVLTVRNTASLLGLVKAGVGVTVLPRLTVMPEFSDLAFLPLADVEARRTVWIVIQPKRLLTPAARALANMIRTTRVEGVAP